MFSPIQVSYFLLLFLLFLLLLLITKAETVPKNNIATEQ